MTERTLLAYIATTGEDLSPGFDFYPVKRTEQGALDGHAFRCHRCGVEHKTSLSMHHARMLASEHADWHARKEAGKR